MVEVRSDLLGATAEATLEAVHALGVVLQAQGHFDLARQKLSTCLDRRHALLGETHPDTLAVRADLANVLQELGNGRHAAKEHRRIFDIRERTLGPMHQATLDSLIQLGWSLKAIDEFEEAEHCFREAVARATSGPRERVAPSLAALNGLAMVLEARGRLPRGTGGACGTHATRLRK